MAETATHSVKDAAGPVAGKGPGGSARRLEMRNISKRFPGVLALDGVSFNVRSGEVHALVGQNGAGKSTLMSILSGAQFPDDGEMLLDGQPIIIDGPLSARRQGIAIVHQEFALCPNMTVAENVFVGREPCGRFGVTDKKEMRRQTAALLQQVQVDIDPDEFVENLGVSEWQVVEICKALAGDPKFVIMDEPTAALNDSQVKDLLDVIRRLRDSGHGIIYISHKLSEVLEIATRVTVLRDGKLAETLNNEGVTETDLVEAMIGSTFERQYQHDEHKVIDTPILELRGVENKPLLRDITLDLHQGEILGLTGILGSGCQELVRALFGIEEITSGDIVLDGRTVTIAKPRDAVRYGIGYIPADRKYEGLLLSLSTLDNASMAVIDRLSSFGLFKFRRRRAMCAQLIDRLDIKVPNPDAEVRTLSGGNQQKILIAKWLSRDCKILLFDEPTRGVDVNAKAQIWEIINELAGQGTAVLVVSSELPELMQACDRIMVMRKGRIIDEFARRNFNETKISTRAAADA